jgi:polysaccharide deacetylase family protein (PEP-CTERM system associated)
MVSANRQVEKPAIVITIDVEDWFQVENFKTCISFVDWACKDLRVEKNTRSLLDFFDRYKIRATFFVLGWIAERIPKLVKEIHSRGHEIASHGYYHALCRTQTAVYLKRDLTDSKKILEDITSQPIYGYRAPSFSISDDVLKIIAECGYFYDSSFNSFQLNKRYGQIDLTHNNKKGIVCQVSDGLYELPISNIRFCNYIFPWGGGGYFRLIPFPLFRMGVQYILKRERAYLFYLHPWEIDQEQPTVKEAPRHLRFMHYTNLHKTLSKLVSLVEVFKDCRFISCQQHIVENYHLQPLTLP